MSRFSPAWRDTATLALLLFTAGLTAGTLYGEAQADASQQPQVVILGDRASQLLLISSGDARLLIVNGPRAGNLLTELGHVREPFRRRIDLVVLTGTDVDPELASFLDTTDDVRRTVRLDTGDGTGTAHGRAETLPSPVQISLPDGLSVSFDTHPGGSWRAVVARGEPRIVVLGRGADASRFPRLDAAAAVVIADGDPFAVLAATGAQAVVLNADALTRTELEQELTPLAREVWAVRARSDTPSRLELRDDGLRLPDEATLLPSDD